MRPFRSSKAVAETACCFLRTFHCLNDLFARGASLMSSDRRATATEPNAIACCCLKRLATAPPVATMGRARRVNDSKKLCFGGSSIQTPITPKMQRSTPSWQRKGEHVNCEDGRGQETSASNRGRHSSRPSPEEFGGFVRFQIKPEDGIAGSVRRVGRADHEED